MCKALYVVFIMNEIVDKVQNKGYYHTFVANMFAQFPCYRIQTGAYTLATTRQEGNLTNGNDWRNGINVYYLMVFNINPVFIQTMKLEM